MVWNAQNFSILGSPNIGVYRSPNIGVIGGPNIGVYSSPNIGVYGSPNIGVRGAANLGLQAAVLRGAVDNADEPGVAVLEHAPGTGAGSSSGTGFIGGYGPIQRFEYATPAALGPLPWSPDFTFGDGWLPFPVDQRIDPYRFKPILEWQPSDWDPALRFWTLPFDPHLTEWLQDLNLGHPAIVAAREFAGQHTKWLAGDLSQDPQDSREPLSLQQEFEKSTEPAMFSWRLTNPADAATASNAIRVEIEELVDLMRDDRARYLEELAVQSSQVMPYFVHLMGVDPSAKPWTVELMNCASAIGNLVKMQYKSYYKRVRPSTLCPGLTPPWGPPKHPAFPSGHSTVAHLTALFLLTVPGIAQRFGSFPKADDPNMPVQLGRTPTPEDMLTRYGEDQRSPMLWLAWRIAKGRERLGLHYRSDSAAGRRLAALVWECCAVEDRSSKLPRIRVPALATVLHRAEAEWPIWEERKAEASEPVSAK